ncbi:MAG: GntP family permease, partial [Parasporobacterium sp.]|nr:GntP family permease [Parasporobacterium sp.]
MELLSLIGIGVGLILMIILAYKGHSIIWVAPLCAFVVMLFALGAGLGEGRTLLTSYTVDYMTGVGEYFISWFPTFLLGAIFGKAMDITGSAQSLANIIVKYLGARFVVLAVILPCMILTYGGVSLFVVVFIMYPMGYAIFKAADLPRTLLPAIIAFGIMGITMTAIPGTPQIQNLIPMEYFGTTATAAPWLGIIAALVMGIPGYLYLDMRVRQTRKAGLKFIE